MPVSDNITVPYVSMIVNSLLPNSALDIGIGAGKFGFIFREACEWSRVSEDDGYHISKEHWKCRLDGIEVCAKYVTPLQKYLYDEIFIGCVQDFIANLNTYDLIHLGDVIEHIDKSDGQQLLDKLFDKTTLGILIVTPVGEYEQAGTKGNPFEEHKSVWSPIDLRRFPCIWSHKIAKRQWVMLISREMHWLGDPYKTWKTSIKVLSSQKDRQRLKQLFGLLFGARILDFFRRIKRYHEGWNSIEWLK